MQELTTEQAKIMKAKDKECRRKPRFNLVCNQCSLEASFIKVFCIPKKAPQYLQHQIPGLGWGQQQVPQRLSPAHLHFSLSRLVSLSLLVKTQRQQTDRCEKWLRGCCSDPDT